MFNLNQELNPAPLALFIQNTEFWQIWQTSQAVLPMKHSVKGPDAKNKLGPQLNFKFYQYKPKYK